MPQEYTLTPAKFKSLKTKLTKAIKGKDPKTIIATCDEAFRVFEAEGFPDNWSNWQRARDDAELQIRLKSAW